MPKSLIINLPVADLPKATAFYTSLGFSLNPAGTGETTSLIAITEAISVMLMTHAQFSQFTPRAVCDAKKSAEALFVLLCDSRREVDDLVARAVAAGGAADKAEDYGFMYTHGFHDLDGHGWGLTFMSAPPPHASQSH